MFLVSSSTSKTNGSATVTKHRSATRHAADKPVLTESDSRFKVIIKLPCFLHDNIIVNR